MVMRIEHTTNDGKVIKAVEEHIEQGQDGHPLFPSDIIKSGSDLLYWLHTRINKLLPGSKIVIRIYL